LVVDFALYLHALDWSGLAIGSTLSAGGLLGAALSLVVSLTSDRLRRKPFLLFYEFVSVLSGVAALLSAQPLILTGTANAAGLGRGNWKQHFVGISALFKLGTGSEVKSFR
jgi:predicted MFS family arabinose efflux permease